MIHPQGTYMVPKFYDAAVALNMCISLSTLSYVGLNLTKDYIAY